MNSASKIEIDFNNTEKAFQALSDRELQRQYRLYQLIDSPFLTRIGPQLVRIAWKLRLPVEGLIRRTLYDIFCGGEDLEDTVTRIQQLNAFKVKTILDYAVEGEKTEKGFQDTLEHLLDSIAFAGQNEAVRFVAMKITGIASFEILAKKQAQEHLSDTERNALDKAWNRLDQICRASVDHNTPVFIDAEESWIQDVIDDWAEQMMMRYNKTRAYIYTTLQMYRHDRLEYLKALISLSQKQQFHLGLKIVRGAYLEKENNRAREMGYPTPLQPTKEATDRDFNLAIQEVLSSLEMVWICAGTHNEKSTRALVSGMQDVGMNPSDPHVWFSQLLGMSDNLSYNLTDAGYNVAKYVPYGPVKAVIPYLMRRAQENTAIAGQSSREVELLTREVNRRKSIK